MSQVQALERAAEQNPQDSNVRAQLGNLYFDAERYTDAARWYQASLDLAPANADVSTDLAVSFYYTNQTVKELNQFAR